MRTNHKLTYAIMAALSAQAGNAYAADAPVPSGGIEEVVVTAQHRSESIQNVPITIQAIGGDALGKLGVTTFDDVIRLLPNVTLGTNGPGQGTIFMRGLSAGLAGAQSSASINPFPNVATYLDEQSLTFPARSLDVYMVDMERLEVLEGPQGTLFGGGAEAGAIRYITNKPKLNVTEARAEASYGTTAHGDPNTSVTGVLNLPLIQDKLAIRGVVYNDRRGGYIDNVPSTYTRNPNVDTGPSAYSSAYPANLQVYNNYQLVAKAQNPTTYQGMRLSALYKINDDWDVLIQQSYQHLDAEGMPDTYPTGIDFQTLEPLQVTAFLPSYNKDKSESTAWTVNGKIGDLKAIYTGSYLTRNVDQNMDYSNYARTPGGFYYSCSGGPAAGSNFGAGRPGICYSPVMGWHDYFETTHQSHEFRVSTPEDRRLRGLVGAFWEDFQIKDDMNFMQKTIPSCTPANLAAALAGGPICLANVNPVQAAIDPTTRNDSINFGEDLQRGYKQTAFFTSWDFDLIPKVLTVTAGTRYFRYVEQEVGSKYTTSASRCLNQPNGPGTCVAAPINYDDHHATFSGFKSRANLTWHVTPDTMLYYTYSQGYRPGMFNRTASAVSKLWVQNTGTVDAPVYVPLANGVDKNTVPGATSIKQFVTPLVLAPDSLLNNEVGFKGEFLDHRLQVNVSAYQMDWKDVQTLIYNPTAYGNSTFGLTGPTYRVKGAELQLTAKLSEGLTVMGSLSRNDPKVTESPCIQSPGQVPLVPKNPTPKGTCLSQVRSGATNIKLVDPLGSIGSVPAFSPKMQYTVRLRYDWSTNDYRMFAQGGVSHIDEMFNEPSSFASGDGQVIPKTTWVRYTQPAYNTYDASVGVSKDNWDLMAYGQNLSDSHASTLTTAGQFIKAVVPLRPRVLGLKLGYKF